MGFKDWNPSWTLQLHSTMGLGPVSHLHDESCRSTFRWGVVGGGLHIEDQVFRSVVGLQEKSRFVFSATHSPFLLLKGRQTYTLCLNWVGFLPPVVVSFSLEPLCRFGVDFRGNP